MPPTHIHTLAPNNHATLPQPILPIQSLPRIPLREPPTPVPGLRSKACPGLRSGGPDSLGKNLSKEGPTNVTL